MPSELTQLMVAMARVEEKLDDVQEDQQDIKNYVRSLSKRTGSLEQFKAWAIGVGVGLTALGTTSLLAAFTR
jgi:hypothetical protein